MHKNTNKLKFQEAFFEIDDKSLEPQLNKICEILKKISLNYYFDTFIHFKKLLDQKNSDDYSRNIKENIKKWNYKCLDFIQTEKCGNCVDFAVLCQKKASEFGIPTTIIGKHPDSEEFSKEQIDFMKYRHTSVLYANNSTGKLELFMFEPGWKFIQPIRVNMGYVSSNDYWEFETTEITNSTFKQRTYNKHNKKTGERTFDFYPLDIIFCEQLTKHLIRVPRKLEISNKLVEGELTKIIKFDPHRQIFSTNIESIKNTFLPDSLDSAQVQILESNFNYPGLIKYLSKIFSFLKSLPNEFWIK